MLLTPHQAPDDGLHRFHLISCPSTVQRTAPHIKANPGTRLYTPPCAALDWVCEKAFVEDTLGQVLNRVMAVLGQGQKCRFL